MKDHFPISFNFPFPAIRKGCLLDKVALKPSLLKLRNSLKTQTVIENWKSFNCVFKTERFYLNTRLKIRLLECVLPPHKEFILNSRSTSPLNNFPARKSESEARVIPGIPSPGLICNRHWAKSGSFPFQCYEID